MTASNSPLLIVAVFLSLFLTVYMIANIMMPEHWECTSTISNRSVIINGQLIQCEVAP